MSCGYRSAQLATVFDTACLELTKRSLGMAAARHCDCTLTRGNLMGVYDVVIPLYAQSLCHRGHAGVVGILGLICLGNEGLGQ